ncbi:MAG: stage III sporulation protein AF [Clostridiales bacterium]|nr:stage III sporulation protein AF [Clostridiales bacterium]
MGKWVVTVAGIAILSVLCDVILPEGQTRKYVKTVFGVVVTLIIVQPVIQLFGGGISGIFTSADSNMEAQQQYLQNVHDRKTENALKSVRTLLEENDLTVESITVSDAEQTVNVQMNVVYSANAERKVKTVVSAYFPNYNIITVWK